MTRERVGYLMELGSFLGESVSAERWRTNGSESDDQEVNTDGRNVGREDWSHGKGQWQ